MTEFNDSRVCGEKSQDTDLKVAKMLKRGKLHFTLHITYSVVIWSIVNTKILISLTLRISINLIIQNLYIQLEHSMLVHGKISPTSDLPHEHTAPVAMRMPHLPITATTKTAEIKGSPDSPSSPVGSRSSPVPEASPPGQSNTTINQPQPIEEPPIQSGS